MALEFYAYEDIAWESCGVALVLPPWNFPCSIPVGCIAAALMAGNTVVFKPAPQTVWIGYEVAKCFWDAGVPKEVLQFITGDDEEVGSTLVQHPDTGVICLTGSNETAKRIYELNPGVEIIGETGGKNSLIVTALADRDLSISDIVRSAFSHSGQKCSALSLLILDNEVYKDPSFFKQLYDATKSLAVGSSFDPRTKVGPLIDEPQDKLLRGLTTLDEGEEWLIKPRPDSRNNHLWSPGIKLGVKEGSFTHQTELFGPMLGVMRAKNLEHALLIANGTAYGLTAGLHSLDPKEQHLWFQKIKAGNCYINRGITGAIVERQPFGGTKESSFGRGHKAGGPNYLTQFMVGRQIDLPKEREQIPQKLQPLLSLAPPSDQKILQRSLENYAYYWTHYFSHKHDPQKIIGQDNFLIYRPHRLGVCRMENGDALLDLLRVIGACMITSTPLEVSLPKEVYTILSNQARLLGCTLHVEDQGAFLERFKKGFKQRLRLLSPMGPKLKQVVAKTLATVVDDPVLVNGRFELLHYLQEVALSFDYHRYGNLGLRENEVRNDESGHFSGDPQPQ
jgi:RHH-type proline utilization regulon transcriptional repressor/proline dehydrogenase/delta 1-pyrroline-5-carboxylate dehydrogenase